MTDTSKTDDTFKLHPVTAPSTPFCGVFSPYRRFLVAETLQQLNLTLSWEEIARWIGYGTKALWYKAARGQYSREAERMLRRRCRQMPKGIRKIDRMRDEDIAWYMRTRC
jgi:hypothetical protein